MLGSFTSICTCSYRWLTQWAWCVGPAGTHQHGCVGDLVRVSVTAVVYALSILGGLLRRERGRGGR